MSVKQNRFFWSPSVKPESNYKKTHAMVMSNGNCAGDTSMRQGKTPRLQQVMKKSLATR
jgi:hypothetical protein